MTFTPLRRGVVENPLQPTLQPDPAADPRWGEILQRPNLNTDLGGSDRAKALWLARQGSHESANSQAMIQLAAALQAQRDAKMAELLAANAGRGGGGGGGRGGGGGGGATSTPWTSVTDNYIPWIDDYLNSVGSSPPPSLSNSSAARPYEAHPLAPRTTKARRVRGRGAAAANRPAKVKKPSRTRVVLS